MSKRRGVGAQRRARALLGPLMSYSGVDAKVHRQKSKRRESSVSQLWTVEFELLRWPLNSLGGAHAAISRTSSEISLHRGLGCGWRSPMRTALGIKFPDHQGKYRELSRFRASRGQLAAEKAFASLGFLSKFPTQPNRELFWRNREFFRRNRELSGRSREIHLAGGAARNSFLLGVDGVLR